MYYRGGPANAAGVLQDTRTCYAQSTDGIHWVTPDLGLCQDDITGNATNNIVLMNGPLGRMPATIWPCSRTPARTARRRPGTKPWAGP